MLTKPWMQFKTQRVFSVLMNFRATLTGKIKSKNLKEHNKEKIKKVFQVINVWHKFLHIYFRNNLLVRGKCLFTHIKTKVHTKVLSQLNLFLIKKIYPSSSCIGPHHLVLFHETTKYTRSLLSHKFLLKVYLLACRKCRHRETLSIINPFIVIAYTLFSFHLMFSLQIIILRAMRQVSMRGECHSAHLPSL